MQLTEDLRKLVDFATEQLKGSALRRFMAQVVRELGRGGQRRAQEQFGWSRDTIRKGEHELSTGVECIDGRCGSRASVDDRLPNLKADINELVECWSQTDPRFRTPQRYSKLTVSQVAKRLVHDKGYDDRQLPSNETIRKLMHALGFRLRKVRKARPKKKLPETDAIFHRLHAVNAEAHQCLNVLRVCTDAKATVKIGQLCRGGMSWVLIKSLDHDFKPDAVVTPIDVLLPEHDELYLYFVPGSATADAHADVLSHFWNANRHRFPGVDTLLLNQDNGPELHSRRTQFMARLVEMADTTQTTVRLAYYPPYHSKYNPAERPWAVLENEWNGDLLDTVDAAIGHARSMTWKGRHPTVVDWLSKTYEKGKKLGKEAMQAIEDRLERLPGLQKWFVDIAPLPA